MGRFGDPVDVIKQAILDATSDLVVVHDGQMRVLWANRTAAAAAARSPEDLVGQHCYELWHQLPEPCAECPVERAAKSGEYEEGRVEIPSGAVFRVQATPVFDDASRLLGVLEESPQEVERRGTRQSQTQVIVHQP